jgi:hypothetical protein
VVVVVNVVVVVIAAVTAVAVVPRSVANFIINLQQFNY